MYGLNFTPLVNISKENHQQVTKNKENPQMGKQLEEEITNLKKI